MGFVYFTDVSSRIEISFGTIDCRLNNMSIYYAYLIQTMIEKSEAKK